MQANASFIRQNLEAKEGGTCTLPSGIRIDIETYRVDRFLFWATWKLRVIAFGPEQKPLDILSVSGSGARFEGWDKEFYCLLEDFVVRMESQVGQ